MDDIAAPRREFIQENALSQQASRPPSSFVQELSKTLGLKGKSASAMLTKLSGRMRKIATADELADFRTPLNLLLEIAYDERHPSRAKLTPSGRAAVKTFPKC